MVRPRVERTMSWSSVKSGEAAFTLAPSDRKTFDASSATFATSASTGIRPFRSGVHATRQPLIAGALTARRNSPVSAA
jgi:hypothetical protein